MFPAGINLCHRRYHQTVSQWLFISANPESMRFPGTLLTFSGTLALTLFHFSYVAFICCSLMTVKASAFYMLISHLNIHFDQLPVGAFVLCFPYYRAPLWLVNFYIKFLEFNLRLMYFSHSSLGSVLFLTHNDFLHCAHFSFQCVRFFFIHFYL
jgi:hypothetical protein